MNQPLDPRERLCEAAIRTAGRDGILAMTLDAVAKEAGVSKGGVMHHFPTKDALVEAMIVHFSQKAERMISQRLAGEADKPMPFARAILSCVFPEFLDVPPAADAPWPPEVMQRMMLASLAAAVNKPGSFEPLKKLGLQLREQLLESPQGMEQLLVWLVIDGLFLWQFVGLIDREHPLHLRIGRALAEHVGLTSGDSTPAEAPVNEAVP